MLFCILFGVVKRATAATFIHYNDGFGAVLQPIKGARACVKAKAYRYLSMTQAGFYRRTQVGFYERIHLQDEDPLRHEVRPQAGSKGTSIREVLHPEATLFQGTDFDHESSAASFQCRFLSITPALELHRAMCAVF